VRPARGRRDLADWEQCRAGDAGFDLVGLLFDMELWPQGEPAGQRPSSRSPGGLPAPLLAAYVAIRASATPAGRSHAAGA